LDATTESLPDEAVRLWFSFQEFLRMGIPKVSVPPSSNVHLNLIVGVKRTLSMGDPSAVDDKKEGIRKLGWHALAATNGMPPKPREPHHRVNEPNGLPSRRTVVRQEAPQPIQEVPNPPKTI